MRLPIVWTIFLKELRDSLRDRRTLIMMVGLPVLIYPLMIIGAAKLTEARQESTEERVSKVVVWGQAPAPLLDKLAGGEKLNVLESPLLPGELPRADGAEPELSDVVVDAARTAILEREVEAILVIWPGASGAIEGEGKAHSSILFDSVRQDSRKARDRLQDILEEYAEALVEQRLRERGLSEEFAHPVAVHTENVATESRRFGMMLGSMLGFILVFVSALGGFYAAIDLTAGEKERGTMETLLCAPLRSVEIIGGKFMAVWTISLIASAANVASMGFAFGRVSFGAEQIHMTLSAYLLSLLFLVPISFMLSAVFLAISVFAKDFKDGQNYLTPVLMVILFPMMITMMPDVELNAYTAFVPIANIALLIKAVFVAEAKPDAVFLTMLASCLYATLALLGAAKVFERETVLLSGKMSFREIFRIERRPGETPSVTLALVVFAVVLVAAFYLSMIGEKAGIVTTLLVIQYGVFLMPVVAVAGVVGFSPRKTFALRRPGWAGTLGAALVGVSAWTFAVGVFVRLVPVPESVARAMEKILMLDQPDRPLVLLLLVVAVTPAICEEALFRGFIMSALRRYGMWPAVGVSALLFGLAHASIYRLLPTMFLGFVIGYAVWQTRSLFAGMIIHAINNGLAVSIARSPELATTLGLKDVQVIPWSYTAIGTAVLIAGLLLLRMAGKQKRKTHAD